MLTQTVAEKLEQLQTQLTCLKESPQPTKHADQQKSKKDSQHLQQQIDNFQTFLFLEVGQQVTDGKQLGAIASLTLSPGGLPEVWVSWYGKVSLPEQPYRLKPEPLLKPDIKLGDVIAINLSHLTDAGKTFEIAEFRGEGWVSTTTDHLFHYDSFSVHLKSDCQHTWNRTWSADGRAVKVCQLCRLTLEIEDEFELEELLSSLEELKQELVDLAAVSLPGRTKVLMQGVKDKDSQIVWVKEKLAMTSSLSPPSKSSSDWKPRVGDKVRLSIKLNRLALGEPGVIVEIKGNSVRVKMDKPSPSGKPVYAEVIQTHIELVEPASAQAVSVEVVELEELSDEEQQERLRLERQVERAFYQAGQALKKLRDERLHRSTHKSFEEYCRDRFGFERRHPYRLIEAALVVDNLKMRPIGTQILPSSERQVRPLTQLDPNEQQEIWQQAVEEAGGKNPSGRLVKDIVQRIRERTPVPNPFHIGEVCQIIVKENPELRGKGGCWCIVSEVHEFGCTVRVWDGEYLVRIENLKLFNYSPTQREVMHQLCDQLNRLHQTYSEETVLAVFESIGKLNRPYLTAIEEKLLSLLEE